MSKMEICIPIYENGRPKWDKSTASRCAQEEYFNNIDDFIIYLKKLIDEVKDYKIILQYKDLKKQIQSGVENNKFINFLYDDYKIEKESLNYNLKAMPYDVKEEWIQKLQPLNSIIHTNLKQKNKFLKENLNEVYKIIDDLISVKQNDIKTKRSEINKTYYQKKKELLNISSIIPKTEEEKREAKRVANQKYQLKQKELTNNTPRILKTEEEKKEAKRVANQKYYLSKK